MTLDWTFSFIELVDNRPKLQMVSSFRNGKAQLLATRNNFPEVIHQMESVITLLTYIAYFPNKDFTKIKLDTSGNHYAVHFLDKRYIDQGFLGIISVSEYDTPLTYDFWGIEEMMAEFVFDYYMDLKQSLENESFNISEFQSWLSTEIKEFFVEWYDAKKEFRNAQSDPEKQAYFKSNKHKKAKPFEQWWDLQLINEYGAPLTDMISFIDDSSFFVAEEAEQTNQSLESMSLSALKILIDQQGGWNIKYLKNRLNNEMGYSYTFFCKFTVRDIRYLLIMNSAIYDLQAETCLQAFRGNEFELLDLIASKIEHHTMFFTENGQLNVENKELIQQIILNYVGKVYK
ncbi:hypothetical protein [Candidatus Lokiarchaeum ossiferum]|uniref:hypothetical protein n=1 Tax=Candidatus Lokiarchaeum ossiferum TaxID=2951803 RepID=UPI00352D1B00